MVLALIWSIRIQERGMDRKILVITDGLALKEEAFKYAEGLAKRIDALVVILMLLEPGEGDGRLRGDMELAGAQSQAIESLMEYVNELERAGVEAEPWLRIGDPASEFLKFLAGVGRFQAIIWGGNGAVIQEKSRGKQSHWLFKVKDHLDCPLLAPERKDK